jgi:hypothetical protein
MTYSIEVFNQFDERALDFESVYYVHEYGSCIRWPSRPAGNVVTGPDAHVVCPFGRGVYGAVADKGLIADFSSGTTATGEPINWVSSDDGTTVFRQPQFASDTTTTFLYRPEVSGRTDTEVPSVVPDTQTEIFFEVPTDGLTHATTYLQKYDQFGIGVVGIAQPYHTFYDTNSTLKYVFVRPSEPNNVPSETHGMQLFRSDGSKVFDSRFEVISIKDHISISEADMRDVLVNGATKTFNIRQTVNNPYISSGDFTALTWDSRPVREILTLPRIRVVNGNQLVLDRRQYRNFQPGAGYFFDGSSAATILIAEINEP